jgi:diacylglycerol kinase family enzyme
VARALLITNPVASRTSPERSDAVSRVFRALGWRIEVVPTAAPGDARRLAELGVREGVDAVVVFGGDGTAMQAAAALVGTEVGLGLVPGGTGNILAGNLGIPVQPVPAAETIARGRGRWIDLGRVQRDDGVHYFGVACGTSAAARVMGETKAMEKRRWGIGGYLATLLRVLPEIRSTPSRITVDGVGFETRAAMTLALNCGEIVPGLLPVRRGVALDDGLLDLVVITADSPWQCARAVWRVVQNVVLDTGPTHYLGYARGREITVVPEGGRTGAVRRRGGRDHAGLDGRRAPGHSGDGPVKDSAQGAEGEQRTGDR